ncbi:hypothetical protein ANCCEY_12106 [Ancylostoma ceylanicum]|uniref:BACK domain-containing protein n=1 Tax=Ancylostoma ceylanicum TaxID=53326 RepID=A0A0D6LFV8_9BILA|nr:hypothetical protein ANCCEY_12106 [Ancylostoma ceylanicum]
MERRFLDFINNKDVFYHFLCSDTNFIPNSNDFESANDSWKIFLMGGGSSSLRTKSRSSADLDRLKPTAEQRTPKTRSRLASLAQSSSKQLSKLSFKRKNGNRDKVKSFRDLISTWPIHDIETLYTELETSRILSLLKTAADYARPTVPSIEEQLFSSESKDFVLIIDSLRDWMKCHRDLSTDLRCAEKMALKDGDLTIVLTSPSDSEKPAEACLPDYSIRCDSSIISSRSDVFRGLLKHVPETTLSQSSLSEARAIVAGRAPHSPLYYAIQLIHIAKFFTLDRLTQLCEDMIVSALCQESCVSILSWATDGGSQYVAHRAQSFLESEFSQIASTHCLFDISLDSLIRCAQSQFIQATEVELLEAVIRWGEHELLRRMEEREPNVVADTSHSISRRGVKRADLSGTELRAIIAPVTEHLRIDYILPPFHQLNFVPKLQSLNDAYCRGILDRAPLRADLVCPSTSEIIPDIHWFRPDPEAPGPRYYVPYYKIRSEILSAIDIADCQYHIRFFPRIFHRRMAVHLIALRVLRTMQVDTNCVQVTLANEVNEEEPAVPELEDDQSSVYHSQSASILCEFLPILADAPSY